MHEFIYLVMHGEGILEDRIETPVGYSFDKTEAEVIIEGKKPFPDYEWYWIEEVPHLVHLPKET